MNIARIIIFILCISSLTVSNQSIEKEKIIFIFSEKIQSFSNYLFGYPYKYNSSSSSHPNWGGLRNAWTNNNAWDIFVEENTPVYSIIDGIVFSTRFRENKKTVWGYNIIIQNEYDKIFYTHLDQVLLCPGDTIKKGQLVGFIGKWPEEYKFPNGYQIPSHLHIAIYNQKLSKYVNDELKIEPLINPFSIRSLVGV